jgi:hypothetical protein
MDYPPNYDYGEKQRTDTGSKRIVKSNPYFERIGSVDCTGGKWFLWPLLGEHNEYVFKEILYMTDDEISEAFTDEGITTDADLAVSMRNS